MIFEEFVTSVEQHKEQLAGEMARLVLSRRVPTYSDRTVEQLIRQFLPHFEMAVRYVRQPDPIQWRDYFTNLTKERFANGFSLDSVLATSQGLYDTLYQFIDRQWPPSIAEKLNQKYRQRIQGMQTLSETTARMIYISKSY